MQLWKIYIFIMKIIIIKKHQHWKYDFKQSIFFFCAECYLDKTGLNRKPSFSINNTLVSSCLPTIHRVHLSVTCQTVCLVYWGHDRVCGYCTIIRQVLCTHHNLFTDLRAIRFIVFYICLKTTLRFFNICNIYLCWSRHHLSLCISRYASVHVCLQQTALRLCESGTEVIRLFSVSLNTTGSLFRFFISTAPHVLHCISLSACDTRASVSASLGRPGFSCYNADYIAASELRMQWDGTDKTKHKGIHKDATQCFKKYILCTCILRNC